MFGEKTFINETVHLSPNESKTYYLPPGFINVDVKTNDQIIELASSPGMRGYTYITEWSHEGIGSPYITNCTYINPTNYNANFNLTVTTGVLNPFGYIW
jgi:hypothetical protein